jgi:3-dehydroquinate synthase
VNSIQATNYQVHFQQEAFEKLNLYISKNEPSKVIVLVDENTRKDCLPYFLLNLDDRIQIETIEIKAGEIYKNIDTCVSVWKALTNLNTDRKSLLINLGGGMVTDLGGFVASTFKRGIKFINIPTTLLSMVDASVGSKTGVDLGTLKNLIGLFSHPEMVLIDSAFLTTVPKRELHSGLAEIMKYGLTYDTHLWNEIKKNSKLLDENLDSLIYRSVEIKNEVVLQDPKENGLRKILNFGHTIGHAIESYFLESINKETLTHGEAIAIGMVIEGYFSSMLLNFPKDELDNIKSTIIDFFGHVSIFAEDYEAIIDLMKYDKKNIGATVNFVLLENLAQHKIDCTVEHDLLIEGLNFYNQ